MRVRSLGAALMAAVLVLGVAQSWSKDKKSSEIKLSKKDAIKEVSFFLSFALVCNHDATAVLAHTGVGATGSIISFDSLDETGFTLITTPVTNTGVGGGIIPMSAAATQRASFTTVQYSLGSPESFRLNFADVREISVRKGAFGNLQWVKLLDEKGSTLASFPLSEDRLSCPQIFFPKAQGALRALSILCPNARVVKGTYPI